MSVEDENVLCWFKFGKTWMPDAAQANTSVGKNGSADESPVWETIKQLLRQIDNSRTKNDPNTHWAIARRLELLIKDAENPTEKAHIYLEWGAIEIQTGDHRDGLMKLRSALELYAGKPEEHAILLFLIGCVEWLVAEQRNQAISTLGRAVKEFNILQKRYSTNDKKVQDYSDREALTKGVLRSLIEEEKFPPCPAAESGGGDNGNAVAGENDKSGGETVFPGQVNGASNQNPVEPLYWDAFKVWTVSERIPAGGFGPVGVDPFPIADVYLPLAMIEDELYNIFSLEAGSNVINLRSIGDYFVAKVTGDSMNRARPQPFLEGDFVLVKRQEDANHMDIVVVARRDIETLVTFKRYLFSGGIRAIRPESDNPVYTPIFLDARKEYKIIGVAVAVFKKA